MKVQTILSKKIHSQLLKLLGNSFVDDSEHSLPKEHHQMWDYYWNNYLKKMNIGVEYHNTYYIVNDEKKWFFTLLKYGIKI